MFFSCFLLFLRTNFYFLFITNICIPIFNIFLRTDHENFTDIMSTSEKKNNGKVYKYYSIAEPYYDRKTKKNNKRLLLRIGKLSDERTEEIRRFLSLMNKVKT